MGGGNAYVIFRDRELFLEINRRMSAYVMKQTYSLQLAAAVVDCTDDYRLFIILTPLNLLPDPESHIIAVDMDGTLLKSDKTIHKDSITHMHDFHMEVY